MREQKKSCKWQIHIFNVHICTCGELFFKVEDSPKNPSNVFATSTWEKKIFGKIFSRGESKKNTIRLCFPDRIYPFSTYLTPYIR